MANRPPSAVVGAGWHRARPDARAGKDRTGWVAAGFLLFFGRAGAGIGRPIPQMAEMALAESRAIGIRSG